jgi:tetratricopeptide (TPR) repeat protein
MEAGPQRERVEELVHLLEQEPASPLFTELAELLLAAGEAARAQKICERGLGFRPDYPQGHYVYGVVLIRAGNIQEGLAALERAALLASTDARFQKKIGQFLLDSGLFVQAQPYLQRAGELGEPLDDLTRHDLAAAGEPAAAGPEPAQQVPAGENLDSGSLEKEEQEWEMIGSEPGRQAWPDWDSQPPPAEDALAGPPLDEDQEEGEPPTVYQPNLALLAKATAQAETASEPPRTVLDPRAGLRSAVENAIDQVVQSAPATGGAAVGGSEPPPWASAPVQTVAKLEPPTMFEGAQNPAPQPQPPPTVYSISPGGAVAPLVQAATAVEEPVSYLKVFLVLLPFLLGGLALGGYFAWQKLQTGKINNLLEQARLSIRLDSLLGYGEARLVLQNALAIDAQHPAARAMLALVDARLHDEFGPNLQLAQEAGSMLGEGELPEELAPYVLWAEYHLGRKDGLGRRVAAAVARAGQTELYELAARLAQEQGKMQEAHRWLEKAVGTQADDVRSLYSLAMLELQEGRRAQAEELLGKAVALQALHPPALLALAELLLEKNGSQDLARKYLERVSEGIPQVSSRHKARAHALLARLAFEQFDNQRALLQVRAARQLVEDRPDFLLELAELCLKYNHAGEAEDLARAVIKQQPEEVRPVLLLAEAEIEKERFAESLKTLEVLIGKKVPAGPYLLLRGQALVGQGRWAEAIGDLGSVRESATEYGAASLWLLLATYHAGDKKEAAARLKGLLGKTEMPALAQWIMGEFWLDQGMKNAAASAFRQAVKHDPRFYRAHWRLAQLAEQRGQGEEALNFARQALRANPYHPPSALLVGRLLLERREADAALKIYAELVKQAPDLWEAYAGLAEALLQTGNIDKALLASSKAVAGDKDSWWIAYIHGRVLLAKGTFRQAAAFLTRAEKQQDRNPQVLADLGLALLGSRSLEQAEKKLQASLRQKPLARAQEGLARLKKIKRRWEEAARAFEKAARLYAREETGCESSRRLYLEAGHAWLKDRSAGRFAQARRLYRMAAACRQEKDAEALYYLATAWDREDKLEAARAAYQKALDVDPAYPDALFRLGLLEYDDRQDEKARALLERYLAANPQGEQAREAKKILNKISRGQK